MADNNAPPPVVPDPAAPVPSGPQPPKDDTDPPYEPVELHERLHLFLQIAGAVILGVVGGLSIALWAWMDALELPGGASLTVNVGQLLLLADVALAILSIRSIGIGELAGSKFWGKPLRNDLKAGPQFIPFGLMQLVKAPKKRQQFQAPGEPEQVELDDDKELGPGMVRPIRIVTKEGDSKDVDGDILDARMSIVATFPVEYCVENVFDYDRAFGDYDDPEEEVRKQLRDVCQRVASEAGTRHSVAGLIENLSAINANLDNRARDRFEGTGIRIFSVSMLSPDLGKGVSKQLARTVEVRAEAQQIRKTATAQRFATEQNAEAEKTRLTLVGQGEASATLANLSAEAEGMGKKMETLKVSGEALLAAEVGEKAAQNANLILGASGGTADALGLVVAAQAAFTRKTA